MIGQDPLVGRVLVVDDDPVALKNLRRALEKVGHKVSTFSNPLRALKQMEEHAYDVMVTDLKMPYLDGLSLLNEAKRFSPNMEVILITGYASLEGAIEATKQGAFHYLAKPFTPDQLRDVVARALGERALRETAHFQETGEELEKVFPVLIGESPKIRQVEEVIRQIAPTECKGSLVNKFTYSMRTISMSCWFDTNTVAVYPIERKVEKLIVFSN